MFRALFQLALITTLQFGGLQPAPAADLPQLHADSLGGSHVTLPVDAGNKPLVLVVAYDRSAKDAVQLWAHKLYDALKAKAEVYAVIDAAGAPGFVHGFIKSDVAKSAPSAQTAHLSNVLVTFDRTGWPMLAPEGKKEDPAIVVVDAQHHVVSANREPFSADALAAVVGELR